MSYCKNLGPDEYPEQDKALLGSRVVVFFRFELGKPRMGYVRRQDTGPPGETIIELDDGRLILGSECTFKKAVEADG